MKKSKILGTLLISLFAFSLLLSACSVEVAGVSGPTALDKLPVLLSDVIGLDLSKYTITNPSSAINYEYGGAVESEGCSFNLVDEKGGVINVIGQFYNGLPNYIYVRAVDGSFYYTVEPPKNSVEKMKNVVERYVAFAQKYDISTLNVSSALDLLNKAPSSLPKSETSANVSSGDMTLFIAQNKFSFSYTFNGVNIPNKSWSINFVDDDNMIVFGDSFGLYSVSEANVFSDGHEFESFAFDLAQKFCDSFFSEDVKVVWSDASPDVSLNIISGQMYNNPVNNELLEKGAGTSYSKDRDALTLYPMWQAIFYFSQPVGNVVGVQVGVWGDTKEVAYCNEYGLLGGSQPTPSEVLVSETANPPDQSQLPPIAIALIALVSVAAITVFIKKRHK